MQVQSKCNNIPFSINENKVIISSCCTWMKNSETKFFYSMWYCLSVLFEKWSRRCPSVVGLSGCAGMAKSWMPTAAVLTLAAQIDSGLPSTDANSVFLFVCSFLSFFVSSCSKRHLGSKYWLVSSDGKFLQYQLTRIDIWENIDCRVGNLCIAT